MELTHKDGEKKKQKELEIREKMKKRVELEKKTFNIQSLLIESDSVTKQQLIDAAQYMTPEHYADVVYERSAAHICGWPLCAQPLSATSVTGKYKVDRRVGLVDANTARDYHTSSCLMNSKLYAQQLSTEPVYLRTKFTPPVIDQFDVAPSRDITGEPAADLPDLVIRERDTEHDVVELPNLESVKSQAIEGYANTKNSIHVSFSETQKPRASSESTANPLEQRKSESESHESESDSEVDESVADLIGNFFISSKEIPIPELSTFGSLWTMLSHWITPETRRWLRGSLPEPTPDTHSFLPGASADESAVSMLPATDSEAPELIRRNTVKQMLLKYVHMFGDDLYIERTPLHVDLLHHVLDSFDWHHAPKLISHSAALTALLLLHVTLPRVSPAFLGNLTAGLPPLLAKYRFTMDEFNTLAEMFD